MEEGTEAIQSTESSVNNVEECAVKVEEQMSKRQRKKLLKIQEFEIRKREKRLRQRERRKQKKANGEYVAPSYKKILKYNKPDLSKSKISVAFDMQFEQLMSDKDLASCISQLIRCYQVNRRSSCPIPVYFAGVQRPSRTQQIIEKHNGWKSWDVINTDKNYLNVGYTKENIVYLTSESDNVLKELEEGKLYVIGGLVDHNFHKGVCYKFACEANVQTARLPLSEHIEMKTRSVLTINHVFEIILRLVEGNSWQKTLLEVIPKRKNAKPKSNEGENTIKGSLENAENVNSQIEDENELAK